MGTQLKRSSSGIGTLFQAHRGLWVVTGGWGHPGGLGTSIGVRGHPPHPKILFPRTQEPEPAPSSGMGSLRGGSEGTFPSQEPFPTDTAWTGSPFPASPGGPASVSPHQRGEAALGAPGMGQSPGDRDRGQEGPRQSGHLLRDASICTRGRRSGRSWAHPNRPPRGGSAGTGGWRSL